MENNNKRQMFIRGNELKPLDIGDMFLFESEFRFVVKSSNNISPINVYNENGTLAGSYKNLENLNANYSNYQVVRKIILEV